MLGEVVAEMPVGTATFHPDTRVLLVQVAQKTAELIRQNSHERKMWMYKLCIRDGENTSNLSPPSVLQPVGEVVAEMPVCSAPFRPQDDKRVLLVQRERPHVAMRISETPSSTTTLKRNLPD